MIDSSNASEADVLALAMINDERERYCLDPLPLSAMSDSAYDLAKRYARTALRKLGQKHLPDLPQTVTVEMLDAALDAWFRNNDNGMESGMRAAIEAALALPRPSRGGDHD